MKIFFLLLKLFFVILGIFYFRNFNFEILTEFQFIQLLKIIFLIFLFSFFRAIRLGLIFDIFGTHLKKLQLLYISFVSQSFSLLTPGKFGEIYFIQYLKDKKNKNKFLLFGVNKFFEGILLLSLFIFFLLFIFLNLNINNNYEFLIILFISLFFTNFLIFKTFNFFFNLFFKKKLFISQKIIKKIKIRYFNINLYSTFSWLILFYSVSIVSENYLNLDQLFIYGFLNQLSVSLPFSFMGIGIRDILFSYTGQNFGDISSTFISFNFLFIYFLIISIGFIIFLIKFLFLFFSK